MEKEDIIGLGLLALAWSPFVYYFIKTLVIALLEALI